MLCSLVTSALSFHSCEAWARLLPQFKILLMPSLPSGFPSGPAGDQAVNLLLSPLEFLVSMTDQYGSVVGLLLGTERVVLVTGKEAARQVGEWSLLFEPVQMALWLPCVHAYPKHLL